MRVLETPVETIEKAAILFKGVVHTVPRPGRHCDVFAHMRALGIEDAICCAQGFVTSTGRFVRRNKAMRIAKAAGQITEGKFQPDTLFSEDLW